MDVSTIRQRLHNYLEVADDKKVKAIYTIVENEIVESDVSYATILKTELNRRRAAYKADPSTAVNARESKRRIQNKLNAARGK